MYNRTQENFTAYNDRSEKHEKLSTIAITAVLQLQVFRRLSTVLYIGVLVIAYIYWIKSIRFRKSVPLKRNVLVFFLYFTSLPIISLFQGPVSDFTTAIVRYGAMLPFLVIGIIRYDIIYKYSYHLIKTYVSIVVASAVLMIYQVPFGKIWFFVDTAGRLGYERYGSLLGSTTTYGTSSLVAIMCLHDYDLFKGSRKIVFEILIIIGGILCLSKAFFINAAFAYGLMYVFRSGKPKKVSLNKIINGTFVVICIAAVLFCLIKFTFVGNYFRDMMRYTFSSGYLGVESDMTNRVSTRPTKTFAYHNNPILFYLFIGVGFKGFSGVLGLSHYPMCHNNYFDIVLSMGLTALLSLLSVYIGVFFNMKNSRSSNALFVKQIVPYLLVNMMAGQWQIMTVIGILFFCIINSFYHIKEGNPNDGA